MDRNQADREREITEAIARLAVMKIGMAIKNDRNRFNLISKQQAQIARTGMQLVAEVEDELF